GAFLRPPRRRVRCVVFPLTLRPPPGPTLFPYTTLFRSVHRRYRGRGQSVGARVHGAHLPCLRAAAAIADAGGGSDRALPGCPARSEEHTSELQSRENLVCRLLLEKKNEEAILHPDRASK